MSLLAIRVDASTEIGTGHAMRCLSLAHAWSRRGGQVRFLCNQLPEALLERIQEHGHPVKWIKADTGTERDATETQDALEGLPVDWVVVDGYAFRDRFVRTLQQAGHNVAYIDDIVHLGRYSADLVVNQNLHASPEDFGKTGNGTRLLLGPRFALLRPEFQTFSDWERHPEGQAERILLTLGGSDPDNVTGRVLDLLDDHLPETLELTVVVGGSNPHRERIAQRAESLALHSNVAVDPRRMSPLMEEAEIAIAAGGSTSWELAYMQVPTLSLVLADNQEPIARRLDEEGFAINLGRPSSLQAERLVASIQELASSPREREKMAKQGRRLVDGEGTERVVQAMTQQMV